MMVTGAPVRTRPRIAWLMMLAVLVLILRQVAAMPVAAASWQNGAGDRAPNPAQTELSEQEPGIGCHHHGHAQGSLCCIGGACPMLVLALAADPPASHPLTRHRLAYHQGAVHPSPGTNTSPLLPPPRSLV